MKTLTDEEEVEISQKIFGNSNTGDFSAFFDVYNEFASKSTALKFGTPSGPKHGSEPLSYKTTLQVIEVLSKNPCAKRKNVLQEMRRIINSGQHTTEEEVQQALRMAVRATTMTDCDAKRHHGTDYAIADYTPVSWASGETYIEFFKRSIPGFRSNEHVPPTDDVVLTGDTKDSLTAWNLKKELRIKFRKTDDLARHLLFDSDRNVLFLFHHAQFLKAQIGKQLDTDDPLSRTIEDSLKSGSLPPRLLFETLYSLQDILFPPHDNRSARILEKLVYKRRNNFDRGCIEYDGCLPTDQLPDNFGYVHWGQRLLRLHQHLRSRPPRNKLERWLHKKSNEGNPLFAALAALCISICVGIISIGLAGVQIWIGWMAWKHPVR
ncbi:hypothetical protein CDEST_12727 [Colletotrichum destructivum]|uniref:Uncharacterized protein n=1 Tax=Colletotrichum destructivum TaxID=34406 RepID=A0AAX4IX35_9PEZI|nr:hypothetical protein CDEST_12727 [Colletotrichum destructivum]